MVAQHATFLCLCADKRLIKRKQNLVQLKHIVVSVYQEIFHSHIELTAMGQGKPCSADKVLRFIYIQFQCKGKGQCCCLRWLVVHIISDFRKQLSIHICLFIDYRVLLSCAVNQLQKRFRASTCIFTISFRTISKGIGDLLIQKQVD